MTNKIKEIVEKLKADNLAKLNKDSSKEDIDAVNATNKELDGISEESEVLIKKNQDITEMYVEAIKSSGGKSPDKEEGEGETPKSLEEYIQEAMKPQQ